MRLRTTAHGHNVKSENSSRSILETERLECADLKGNGSAAKPQAYLIKELINLDLVLKTVWKESSESMRGELEGSLSKEEKMRSESEMVDEWRWSFDGSNLSAHLGLKR